MVRVAGFEPTASWSRTTRATNCAIPGSYTVFQRLSPSNLLLIILDFSHYVKCRFPFSACAASLAPVCQTDREQGGGVFFHTVENKARQIAGVDASLRSDSLFLNMPGQETVPL